MAIQEAELNGLSRLDALPRERKSGHNKQSRRHAHMPCPSPPGNVGRCQHPRLPLLPHGILRCRGNKSKRDQIQPKLKGVKFKQVTPNEAIFFWHVFLKYSLGFLQPKAHHQGIVRFPSACGENRPTVVDHALHPLGVEPIAVRSGDATKTSR